jgi:hypothetical protein
VQAPVSRSKNKFVVSIVLIAIITVSVLAFVSAQIIFNSGPMVEWKKTYSTASVTAFIDTSDGGFATLGRYGTDTVYVSRSGASWVASYYLTKFDGSGNLKWRQSYDNVIDPKVYQAPVSLVQTNDGDYVIFAYSKSNFPCIIKTDSKGTLEWNQIYQVGSATSYYGSLFRGLLSKDGGFILYGCYTSPGNYGYADSKLVNFVLKIDSQGNLLWNQTFFDDSSYSLSIDGFSAVETNAGSYVMIQSNYLNDPKLFEISSDGKMLQNKTIALSDSVGEYSNFLFYALEINANDELVLKGVLSKNTSTSYNDKTSFLIFTVDSSGNIKSQQELVLPSKSYSSTYLLSFLQPKNENTLITMTSNENDKMFLTKTDPSGAQIWNASYNMRVWSAEMYNTKDGGWILAATEPYGDYSGVRNLSLIKFSSSSVSPPFSPLIIAVIFVVCVLVLVAASTLTYFYIKHRKQNVAAALITAT